MGCKLIASQFLSRLNPMQVLHIPSLKSINYHPANVYNYCSKGETTHSPVNLCYCDQNAKEKLTVLWKE